MNPGGWRAGDGLLLDAVNTLIYADPPVATVYADEARRQGIDLDRETIAHRFSNAFRADEAEGRAGPLTTTEAAEVDRWRRIVAAVLPEVPDPEQAFRRLWDRFGDPSCWRCYPDVGPALAIWEQLNIPWVIASNFDSRLRRIARGLPELARWADSDRFVISSEIGWRKPHPGIYLEACRRLELGPDRVWAAGDDPVNDGAGPRAAGLRAVLVDRRDRVATDLPKVAGLEALVSAIAAAPLGANSKLRESDGREEDSIQPSGRSEQPR